MTALDLMDPDHERWFGIERLWTDADLVIRANRRARVARGDTDGVSVEEQIKYRHQQFDLTEVNQVEEFKSKLRGTAPWQT